MGDASVRIFLPVFKMNFPEIADIALPAEGVFHNLVFVSIRKQYAWQAYKIMSSTGVWSPLSAASPPFWAKLQGFDVLWL